MSQNNHPPPPEALQSVLERIAPGSVLAAVHPLEGDFSNSTHLVDGRAPNGSIFQVVARRYAVFGDYDRGEKARREFKTLQLLAKHGLPAPEPLYLDDTGAVLGSPGIITRYMPGKLVMAPPYPAQWAEKLAKTLAGIHGLPMDACDTLYLLDANREALWFMNAAGPLPEAIAAHPKGAALWQAISECLPFLDGVCPGLVHLDYWSGNILWHQGAISAVVDWEEAALGDPAIDVAYCRMDMALCGNCEAAERFTTAYEQETGKPAVNLGFWELAAAARPMFNPDGWISESPARERFADFVGAAIHRALLARSGF